MREHRASFGPCTIPIVPYGDFTPCGLNRDDALGLWRIIGPTVQRNSERPLWEQFLAVYMQGLQNGSAAVTQQASEGEK